MTQKRAFLLARARQIVTAMDLRGHYDDVAQLNVAQTVGDVQPLVMKKGLAITMSKTHAAPGDDDPDIEAEDCY